ncbi:hypothetical protein A0256_23110 [Mucilaginibacter sp. PAMC 26640]|nr:hypothetical protein A0256_23110 [Mucilaginibacter sp. PAMC 26640]
MAGINLKAKVNIDEAKAQLAELKKLIRDVPGVSMAGGGKAFDAKPLSDYQKGLLDIKRAAAEAANSNKAGSLAMQSALRDARLETQNLIKAQRELEVEIAKSRSEAQSFKTQVDALKVSEQELKNQFNAGRLSIQQFTQQIEQNKIAQQALNAELTQSVINDKKASTALREYNLQQKQLAAAAREARTAQRAASGSYDEASARLKELGRSIRSAQGGFDSTNPVIREQITEYNKLNQSLKDFDARMGNHQRNVGDYKGALGGALEGLKSLVLGYVSLQGALSLVNQSFDVALKSDAIKTSLAFTLGSADAATDKLKELKNTADRLGLSFTPLATTYASFAGAARAANFSLADTDKIFNSVSGAAARFHLTSDQLAGSLLAIQQMISKGTVQSEELRGQLGERLPGAFSIAARAMGVSEKELGKLLQTGQVLASDLLPKLSAELDKTFNLDGATKIDSLTASTNRLSTAFDNALKSDGAGKFFKQIVDGAAAGINALDKLLGSRSFNELSARILTPDASNFDKQNAVTDNYTSSNKFLSKNTLNPTGTSNKNVISALATQSLSDLEKLRAGYVKATKEAEQAVNIYKKGIKNESLTESGKISVKAAENNFKVLQANLAMVNTAYAEVAKNQKKVKLVPEVSDEDLKTVKEINKRILELKNDALSNPTKRSGDIIRIDELKKRLKELNGPIKESVDSELNARNSLQAKINELTKKGVDKQLSADDQELESVKDKYKKMQEAAVKFNNDPANKRKGLRVDAGGLVKAEANETDRLKDKQGTEALKVALDAQKKLYDDYENYKDQVGQDSAKKRYAGLIDTDKTYLQSLKAKQDEILGADQKSKGGSDENTAGNALRLAELKKRIAAETEAEKAKYDDLLKQLLTYQDKATIAAENYEADKKRIASNPDNLNADQIAEQYKKLEENYTKSISEISVSELTDSVDWKNLFSNLDDLAVSEIERLLTSIQGQFGALSKKLSPIDLASVRKKLQEAKDVLIKDNPFRALGAAIQTIFSDGADGAKKSAGEIKADWNNLAAATAGSFKFVSDAVDSCEVLKDAIGEVGTTALSSLSAIAQAGIAAAAAAKAASAVASTASAAIKAAEKASVILAVISAALVVVQAIASVFKSIFAKHDKDIEKSIQTHKEQVKQLSTAYNQLERDIKNAVGAAISNAQQAQIDNLKKQQEEIIKMRDAEATKKKADQSKIDDYNEQIAEIPDKIRDITNAMNEALTGTTAKGITDAIIQGFKDGKRSVADFADSFKGLMEDALLAALKTQYLDVAIADFYKRFTEASRGGLTEQEYTDLQKDYNNIVQNGLDQVAAIDKITGGPASSSAASNITNSAKNIAAITTDQASALDGLLRGSYDIQKRILVNTDKFNDISGKMYTMGITKLQNLELIQVNTANTVIELQNSIVEIKKGNASLESIDKNTKAGSVRGSGLGV